MYGLTSQHFVCMFLFLITVQYNISSESGIWNHALWCKFEIVPFKAKLQAYPTSLGSYVPGGWNHTLMRIKSLLWTTCLFTPKFICRNSNSNGILGGWDLWEVIRLGEWSPHDGMCALIKRYKREFASLLCEVTGIWPFASQEADPHPTVDLLATWLWTSQPSELWEMNVCYLSHPVIGNYFSSPNWLRQQYVQT